MGDWPVTPISFQQNPYGGPITLDYLFSIATANADPGTGYFALNNATENTATKLYIDVASFDGVAAAGVLDNLTNSTNANKAFLRIVSKNDVSKFLLFYITAWATHTGYRELTLAIIASSAASPFAAGDECLLMVEQIGDVGATGATGAPGSSGGGGSPSINDFRLTLASGNPVYNPQMATPSSTDTTNMTVTFTNDPLWVTGTIVTVQTTAGGLTSGTRYWIRLRSANLYSFHTSLAGAQADTGKVTLTASITSAILPSGIQGTTIYLSPFKGGILGLYNGSSWDAVSSGEVPLVLGTLTNATNYDVFAYNNSGTVAMEFLAWTSNTVRATALVRQNGILCKTGALTRRYVGTFRTDSTTTTIQETGVYPTASSVKLFLFNADNPVVVPFMRLEQTTAWTYTSASWRQANASTNNQIEVVCGLDGRAIEIMLEIDVTSTTTSASAQVGLAEDSTTVTSYYSSVAVYFISSLTSIDDMLTARMAKMVPIGYHYYAWLEYGGSNITMNSAVNLDRRRGLTGTVVL